jgi:hypothetical protein
MPIAIKTPKVSGAGALKAQGRPTAREQNHGDADRAERSIRG